MSATDELRRLLDDHGVQYEVGGNDRYQSVFWRVGDVECTYLGDGRLSTLTVCDYATIEQAIVATLGRGTCHVGRGTSGLMHVTTGHCSECGAEVVKPARYCSNCGRKVVEQ